MITLTKDDAALPFFNKLENRKSMNIIETADTIKSLISVLYSTSTACRPILNGSSTQFVAEQLGISRSMISQYISISSIQSQRVKQMLSINCDSIGRAYYISRIKGKSYPEIETLQLQEIGRTSTVNEILIHKMKTAQMILKNLSTLNHLPFNEVDYQYPLPSARSIIENIEKCISTIAPTIQTVKILSEQLNYCNFLIIHHQSKCICGSTLDPDYLANQKEKIIDEIISMKNKVMDERKHVSLLLSAKKDLENLINKDN